MESLTKAAQLSLLLIILSLPVSWTNADTGTPWTQGQRESVHAGLIDAANRTRTWTNAWGITYTALAVGQVGGAILATNENNRVDLWIGSARALLGIIPTWIMPPAAVSYKSS